MSRTALAIAASAAVFAALVSYAEANASKLPTHKKPSDWTQSEMEEYGIDILARTAAFGLGLAVLYGIFECVCCCYCCCASPPSKALQKKNPHFNHFSELNDKWSKKLPSPKWFFIGALAFLVAFMSTTLGTWGYWTEYKVAMVDTYDGVENLASEFAGFLCSEDNGNDCADGTIGAFLEDAKVVAGETLDEVYDYLAGLDQLTEGLEGAIEGADDSIDYLNAMDDTIDRINDNITAANNILTDLQSNPDVPADIKLMLPDEIEEVDDGNVINDAINMVLESQASAVDIKADLDDFYDDTVGDLLERIDGDENTGGNDDRLELFETIDDILESIMDTRDDVLDIAEDIHDNRDTVEMIFDFLVLGVSLFFAIPCIVLLITTLMSKLCCKVAPVYTNMCFTYCFQGFFCFAAGMTLFFAILWNDVCVVHDDVIKVSIGNYTTKIRNTEVGLYDTVMDVLKCGHNKNSDVDQNLAAILGIEQEFNVSEYTDPVIEDMYEVRDHVLNQTGVVEDTIDLIGGVVDLFADFAVTTESYTANVTAAIAEVDSVLAALPSYDMGNNRDDTTEQAKVEEYYTFSFADYQTEVDNVNDELEQMNSIPPPFDNIPLTFQTIKDLTPDVMTSPEWFDGDNSGTCDAGVPNCADYGTTTYTNVNAAVNAAYVYTQALDTIIAENNNLIDKLLQLRQYLVNIGNDIEVLEAQEQAVFDSTDSITASLEGMIDDINDAAAGIDDLVVQVYEIVDFVATAPEYLSCKWIGNFYVNTIKGSFCTDSVDALFNASAPMVSVPTLMMLFFCFAAVYIPVLKDVKYRKKNQKALGEAFDLENNATAPPPPSLALVDAVPEQKTNELEMGAIKGGDESRPSSGRRKMDFN